MKKTMTRANALSAAANVLQSLDGFHTAAEAQAAAAVAQALIALGNALTNDEVLTWDSSDRPQAKVN
jgi:hypothetical protein